MEIVVIQQVLQLLGGNPVPDLVTDSNPMPKQ